MFKEGKIAAYVRMKDSTPGDFGTLGQSFRAEPFRGKRVRLSVGKDAADATAMRRTGVIMARHPRHYEPNDTKKATVKACVSACV